MYIKNADQKFIIRFNCMKMEERQYLGGKPKGAEQRLQNRLSHATKWIVNSTANTWEISIFLFLYLYVIPIFSIFYLNLEISKENKYSPSTASNNDWDFNDIEWSREGDRKLLFASA